jgi:hypothetical protein
MPSRKELELRAAALNIDVTVAKYHNDSVLEQAVIYAETQMTAKTNQTTKTPSADAKSHSGGANV